MQNNNKEQINPLPFETHPPNGSGPCYLLLVLCVWGGTGGLETELWAEVEVGGQENASRAPQGDRPCPAAIQLRCRYSRGRQQSRDTS